MYGLKVNTRPFEEGGTGIPTAEEILIAYAVARGFGKTGQGQPDESRAARYILKDYVNGKLLFCHPPPNDPPIDPQDFNRELYDMDNLPMNRKSALAARTRATNEEAGDGTSSADVDEVPFSPLQGAKSTRLDKRFFGPGQGDAGHLKMPFNHKYSEQGMASGKQLTGRKERAMIALERNIDPSELKLTNGKKHFKGGRKKAKAISVADT
jgi:large subunit GTPase 1